MEKKHYNELVLLSQEIYDHAADRLTNYCAEKYCGIGNDSMEQQLEDYLFTARQTSAFLLGNALALLSPESREEEIQSFLKDLRRVTALAESKFDGDSRPN